MNGTEERMRDVDDVQFHEFVSARLERWRRSAYLLCQDWHRADDVVSVTVGKLYDHWRVAREADNIDAYAQRILTRAWLNETRRPWRREFPHGEPPDSAVPDLSVVVDRESLAALLRSLGPRQRAVIVLRFYLDHTVEETASILGISEGTVKSQSARGLAALRLSADSFRA
jgi:RNA polymerase sigma-70 factor (sigma-E family)